MFRKILVPTDGSELSQQAVAAAVSFAREVGAKIAFLYAKPDFAASFYGESALMQAAAPELLYEITERQAQDILSKATAMATAADVSSVTFAETTSKPYEAMIAVAKREHCDLIIMASHGRSGVGGVLLGSETHKVLTHCGLPVLVYRKSSEAMK